MRSLGAAGAVARVSWLGFDQRMRATKVAPSAPRCFESFMNIPSDTVTQDSDSLNALQPKFPNSAPRSGTTTFSVRRSTRSVAGSTCAMNRGAR